MSPQGRDTKLTDTVRKAILTALAAGVDRKHACLSAGVTDRSLQRWLKRAREQGDEPYASFLSEVTKAEADAVVRNVAIIQKAGQTTWQAAAWWLERRHPDLYGSDRRRIRELEQLIASILKGTSNVGDAISKAKAIQPEEINTTNGKST
jgi:hypothetical protein